MLQGLYSAASGMEAQQTQLDAVSNDLANLNTPGYESTEVGFQDLL
jgi:flagellar basal-body rod protein FlgG